MISKRVLILGLLVAFMASVASAQIVHNPQTIVNTLSIAPGGTLDIMNGTLVVKNGDFATLNALLLNGYNAGDWLGTGITSANAAARANTDGLTGVALVSNDLLGYTDFGGATGLLGTSNEILGKYTWLGDTDMDGVLTTIDYTTLLAGYGLGVGGWEYGDTDYNGLIQQIDYTTFLSVWGTPGSQTGPPTAAAGAGMGRALAPVPEPSCFVLLAVGGLLLLGYKKFIKG